MRDLFRTLPLMGVVILVPALPFLLFGGQFDDWLRGFARDPPSVPATTAVVVGLVAVHVAKHFTR